MSIAEIRNAIRTANWNRSDATGGTREENARTNLPAILLPQVTILEALEIPPRFARDIENRATALAGITAVLARWNVARDVIAPLPA